MDRYDTDWDDPDWDEKEWEADWNESNQRLSSVASDRAVNAHNRVRVSHMGFARAASGGGVASAAAVAPGPAPFGQSGYHTNSMTPGPTANWVPDEQSQFVSPERKAEWERVTSNFGYPTSMPQQPEAQPEPMPSQGNQTPLHPAPAPAAPQTTAAAALQAHAPATRPAVSTQALEPLLDTRMIIWALFESRWLIILLVAGFAALGGAATLTLSQKYSARVSLYFDPARIQLTWDGQSSSQVLPQTVASLVQSQIQILRSNAVMLDVVNKLNLASDGEFASPLGGAAGVNETVIALSEAVRARRVGDSFVISVTATTKDPTKSAQIANAVVDAFYRYETNAASEQYKTVTSTMGKRLSDLREKAFAAEKAVEDYRAKNDLVIANGVLISDDRLAALNEALVAAEQRAIEAGARVQAASRLSIDAAVAGTGETEVSSATLVDLRRQYATAAAELGRLQSQLGTRHPAIAGAQATLGGLRKEISAELKRISTISQRELAQAQKAKDEIAKELTAQKALKRTNSPNQAALENLELQATTARSIYEAMLRRTREKNEEYNNLQSSVRVIGQAEPPNFADGPSRKMLLVGGVFGGAVLGLALGLFAAIARRMSKSPRVRSYFTFSD